MMILLVVLRPNDTSTTHSSGMTNFSNRFSMLGAIRVNEPWCDCPCAVLLRVLDVSVVRLDGSAVVATMFLLLLEVVGRCFGDFRRFGWGC